jgi:8-oxo-dGTP diphosphatase
VLKDWLVDLNEMEEDVPHRPGKLYKLRPGLKKNGKLLPKAEQRVAV